MTKREQKFVEAIAGKVNRAWMLKLEDRLDGFERKVDSMRNEMKQYWREAMVESVIEMTSFDSSNVSDRMRLIYLKQCLDKLALLQSRQFKVLEKLEYWLPPVRKVSKSRRKHK